MPRIATVQPGSPSVKAVFDGPLKGKHFNLFTSLAASPVALDVYLGMAGPLSRGLFSLKEREMVQLAISQANRCGYCIAAHTAIGKSVGMTDDDTVRARLGKLSDPRPAALVRFAIRVHETRGDVPDADITAFRDAGFSDGHMAEVVALYALAIYTNTFNVLNRTEVDFPAPPAL